MPNEGLELDIYKYGTPTVKAATLYGRKAPKILNEMKAVGGGEFSISATDPQILADPTLLNKRNICKFKANGTVVGAMLLGQDESIVVGTGEKAAQGYHIAGEGLKSWFDDAEVRPYGGLDAEDGTSRYFNFATERGNWYVSGDWIVPTVQATVHAASPWTNNAGTYEDFPHDWPAGAPSSKWIWVGAYTDPAPDEWCYFRWEITLATAGAYAWYVAVDNYFAMFIDGEQVAQNLDQHAGWLKTTRVTKTLSAGAHVIAFKARNSGATDYQGPAALLASMFKLNEVGGETLIDESGSANWRCQAYPVAVPSWTIGEIALKLLAEASARGVAFASLCAAGFTATTDSSGAAWTDKLEWAFKIGESYASVFAKFEELVDVWIDPVTYQINIRQGRGFDRSIYVGLENARTAVPIELRIGEHLTEASTKGRGKIKNALSILTTEGWRESSDATSVSKYGRLEGSLDTGTNPELATKLAGLVFAQRAIEEEGASYNFITTTYVPHVHFDLGDWLLAPNKLGVSVKRRVMSITTTENSAGKVIYNCEFDTIFRDNEARLNKVIEKLGGGGVGGSMSNVSGSTPGIGVPVTPPPTGATILPVPKAPTGLAATSQGKWSADGVTAYTEITLTWNPVTQDMSNNAVTIQYYNIRGYKTGDPNYVDWGYVTGTTAKLQPFVPAQAWQFQVQAVTQDGVEGAWSSLYAHTAVGPGGSLLAPDKPTLSSSRGNMTINWDGLLSAIAPPPEFRYVFAEVGPSSTGPWNRMGPSLDRTQRNIGIPNLTIGGTYWVQLLAVDGSGYVSAASPTESITIVGVTGPDMVVGTVDANVLIAGSVKTNHISPEVGNELNIAANGSITLIAGQAATAQATADGTQIEVEEMRTYYDFGASGAIISKPGSVFSTAVRNDRIEMLENGNVISFWSSGIFNVNQMVVDKITMGNHQIEKYGADDTVVRAL